LCYANADLEGEAHPSKSTSGIVIYALGTFIFWNLKMQGVVGQSTMQAEMIATVYGKVQIELLSDLTSVIGIASKDITRCILKVGLNCLTTLSLGNFQSDSQH